VQEAVKTDEERIYAVLDALHDGRAEAFAPDADAVDAAGIWRRGRAEIAGHAPASRGARVSIRFLGRDVAVVHLGAEGITTLVMSRAKGAWRVDAAHSSGRNV
jgi:hypothetical protein